MGPEPERKFFWRINFDVIKGKPRLRVEMTLWELFPFNRLGRLVKSPEPEKIGNVEYLKNRAAFNGGYLNCAIDLYTYVHELLDLAGIEMNVQPILEEVSTSLSGENVSIRADVVLYEQSGKTTFPIFYFPQPNSNGVRLIEMISNGGERTIEWRISDQVFTSSPSFTLETFNARHGVRVRQDQSDMGDIFEFLVDSIPLGDGTTISDHQFSSAP